jgi:peroxiredoxin
MVRGEHVEKNGESGPTAGAIAMVERHRAWKSGHLVIALFLIVPGVLLFLQHHGYLSQSVAREVGTATNQPFVVPDFSLVDAEGNPQRLSTLRGHVVLLNFWATWCPPCRAELPSLEALYQAYQDQGLTILAVASDRQGAQAVSPFIQQYRLTFPVLLDPSGEVTRLYGVASLPTMYFLDREGRLVMVAVGGRDWTQDKTQALIVSLLNGREPRSHENAMDIIPSSARPTAGATRHP